MPKWRWIASIIVFVLLVGCNSFAEEGLNGTDVNSKLHDSYEKEVARLMVEHDVRLREMQEKMKLEGEKELEQAYDQLFQEYQELVDQYSEELMQVGKEYSEKIYQEYQIPALNKQLQLLFVTLTMEEREAKAAEIESLKEEAERLLNEKNEELNSKLVEFQTKHEKEYQTKLEEIENKINTQITQRYLEYKMIEERNLAATISKLEQAMGRALEAR